MPRSDRTPANVLERGGAPSVALRRAALAASAVAALLAFALPPAVQAQSAAAPVPAPAAAPAATHHTEYARMRDGVLLPSEVYLPAGNQERLPVVLVRSPYNGVGSTGCANGCEALAAQGYAVVNQDVRGTGRAPGTMTPFLQEQQDGYDAVEWAAAQPWSNGKVGMWGVSYYGVTVLQAATTRPPHLVAAVAVITGSDYHDNWTYVNGVFDQWFAQSWLGGWARVDAERRRLKAAGESLDAIGARDAQMHEALAGQLPEWNGKVPLAGLDVFRDNAPFYYDWLARPDYSPYWEAVDLERHYADIQVPVLLVGGWYDIFSVGTIRNFIGLRGGGGSAIARNGTRLEMYPLCHGHCSESLAFTPDFWSPGVPPMSQGWWDRWLKGVDGADAHEPPVKLYVMSPPDQGNQDAGHWVTGDAYPLRGTRMTRWSLASGGHANTRNGDGRLLEDQSRAGAGAARQIVRGLAAPDRFTYDPNDPVPTLGGNLCCNDAVQKPGAIDQAALELRNDVLVYSSEPLAHDVTVIGPVQLHFWARSSAPDTDFTAKLVDVRPDGVALNVLDRIVNAGLRGDSKRARSPIQPGKAYAYDLLVGNTALVFKAGHRIRLEVSSSNFPHYARNPNTGEPAATATRFVPAQQVVLHDAAHRSWLELPVVDPRP